MSVNLKRLSDNAIGLIQNNPLPAGGTNLIVNPAIDAKLNAIGSFPFLLTFWTQGLLPDTDPNVEIVTVTARPSANNYTIVRTVNTSWQQNDNVALLWTKENALDVITQDPVDKGTIVVYDALGVPHALPIGTDGFLLFPDHTQILGIKWAPLTNLPLVAKSQTVENNFQTTYPNSAPMIAVNQANSDIWEYTSAFFLVRKYSYNADKNWEPRAYPSYNLGNPQTPFVIFNGLAYFLFDQPSGGNHRISFKVYDLSNGNFVGTTNILPTTQSTGTAVGVAGMCISQDGNGRVVISWQVVGTSYSNTTVDITGTLLISNENDYGSGGNKGLAYAQQIPWVFFKATNTNNGLMQPDFAFSVIDYNTKASIGRVPVNGNGNNFGGIIFMFVNSEGKTVVGRAWGFSTNGGAKQYPLIFISTIDNQNYDSSGTYNT